MEATKLRLLLDFPFFGSLAMRLPLVADASVPSFQTNGVDIRYNQTYVDGLSRSEKMFDYIRMIMHTVLGHFERRGNRDPDIWQIACAFATNQMIPEEHGVRRPHGILIDDAYENQSSEEIYAQLAGQFLDVPREGGVDPEGDEDPGDGPVHSADSAASAEVASHESQGPGEDVPLEGEGDHQGDDYDYDQETFRAMLEMATAFGQVVEPPEGSEVTASGMRGAAAMIGQIMEADGKHIPDQIKKLVYTITDTRLPWTEFLSKFLHESCMTQYNWMKPNQRYAAVSDFIFPSLRSNNGMTLAVVIDTSKSINTHKLNQFMSEFFALISSINHISLTVLTCTSEVLGSWTIYPGQVFDGDITGGGATKFSPAFNKIDELGITPACLVYFTDLGSDDFGPAPPYPVMWIGDYTEEWEEAHRKRVPFGQILSMRE